jgi:hypothetical protein
MRMTNREARLLGRYCAKRVCTQSDILRGGLSLMLAKAAIEDSGEPAYKGDVLAVAEKVHAALGLPNGITAEMFVGAVLQFLEDWKVATGEAPAADNATAPNATEVLPPRVASRFTAQEKATLSSFATDLKKTLGAPKLTKAELAACKRLGLDPVAFAARKENCVIRDSRPSRKGKR